MFLLLLSLKPLVSASKMCTSCRCHIWRHIPLTLTTTSNSVYFHGDTFCCHVARDTCKVSGQFLSTVICAGHGGLPKWATRQAGQERERERGREGSDHSCLPCSHGTLSYVLPGGKYQYISDHSILNDLTSCASFTANMQLKIRCGSLQNSNFKHPGSSRPPGWCLPGHAGGCFFHTFRNTHIAVCVMCVCV